MAANELNRKITSLVLSQSRLLCSYTLSKQNKNLYQRIHTTRVCMKCNDNAPGNGNNTGARKTCCRPSLKNILPACYENKKCSLITAIVFPLAILTLILALAEALLNYIDCLEDNELESEKPCSPPRKIAFCSDPEKCSLKEKVYMALTLGIENNKKDLELETPVYKNIVDESYCEENNMKKPRESQLNKFNESMDKMLYFCWRQADKVICRKATKEEQDRVSALCKECPQSRISSLQKIYEGSRKKCKETPPKTKEEKRKPEIKHHEDQKKSQVEKDSMLSDFSSPLPHEKIEEDSVQNRFKNIDEKILKEKKSFSWEMINLLALLIILLTMLLT